MDISQIVSVMQSVKTPNNVIESLIKVNPQANFVISQMRQSGMSAKEFVMNYANQNNIPIQQIVNTLHQVGIML